MSRTSLIRVPLAPLCLVLALGAARAQEDAPADAPPTPAYSRSYSFGAAQDLDDFETKGFDLVDTYREGTLTLGAGSRGVGLLRHSATLEGDVDVELEVVIKHNTPSAALALVLNDKVSVLWGQQIVKSRTLRPWDRKCAPADQTLFREERPVRLGLQVRAHTLHVLVDGREVASREFPGGELKEVRFGLLARNVRFLVRQLTVRGKPAGATAG